MVTPTKAATELMACAKHSAREHTARSTGDRVPGVHRVEGPARLLLPTSNLKQLVLRALGAGLGPRAGGRRCLDVPLTGYTARLNSDREQAAWVLDILEANRRLAQETRDGIFASHRLTAIAPEIPAARANGTVRPSDMPTTTSRNVSLAVKCFSACSGCRCSQT